jgi:hypothetical protein
MNKSSIINSLRAIYWGMMAVAILFFIWISVPSSLILRHVEFVYLPEEGVVKSDRIVNWPKPIHARFVHSFYYNGKEKNGELCTFVSGIRPYDPDIASERIPIPKHLQDCLKRPDVVGRLSWSVLALGFIPMRPNTMMYPDGS